MAKYSLFMLVVFVGVCVYVANLADLLSVSPHISNRTNDNIPFENGDFKHLMWFMQISDLHLSQFTESSRIDDLKEFCRVNVNVIKPSVVLATGDLTDGKTSDGVGSREMEEEWKSYYNVLKETKVLGVTQWLDTRGNHDNFDVTSIDSQANYFRAYSAQGGRNSKSYARRVTVDGESYWFIAVDACLEPGPRRPFNFVGLLTEDDARHLSRLEVESRNGTATIWFGHYPTSCVVSPDPGLRHLMRNGVAYLCGHLHTFGGLAPRMYTRQKSGNLELELADWKDHRVYRVGVMDHGLFSFTDIHFHHWPVVIVTNPKDSVFAVPSREPLHRMALSTHIRVLAFSPSVIESAYFNIDNGNWRKLERVRGPLFVAPWNPTDYGRGLHAVTVRVKDTAGREETVTHSFSLDGSAQSFGLLPRMLLMSNLLAVVQALFGMSVVIVLAPLCVLRAVRSLHSAGRLRRLRCLTQCLLRRLWIVASLDRFFYPMVFMTLYVPFGPWLFGEVLEGHVGVVFSWGMYVKGAFLPGGITYIYGIGHLWTFNALLLMSVSHCADARLRQLASGKALTVLGHAWAHVPVVVTLSLNTYIAYLMWLAYGTWAFFFGPLKTWSLVGGAVIWHHAATLTDRALVDSSAAFYPRVKTEDGEERLPLGS